MPAKKRRLARAAGDERKRKYGQKTEMLAVRVPASLHDAVKRQARKDRRPKSETVVAALEAGLRPAEAPIVALDGSVFE